MAIRFAIVGGRDAASNDGRFAGQLR